MIYKLAKSNIKNNKKDYLIYFITVTIAFSLIFSFNLISNSKDILELSSLMKNFQITTIFVNLIVCVVVGFLINYTIKFMLLKRSREFGIYLLLGIDKKKLNHLFLVENLILGGIAFVLSFFLGILLSNISTYIIMNIFELSYQVALPKEFITSVLLSIVYFVLIYAITSFLSYKRMKKMNIKDYLNYEKKKEEKKNQTKKRQGFLFLFALILGVAGLYIIKNEFKRVGIEPNFTNVLGASFFILISIYGITSTSYSFILQLLFRNKKIKYQKDHLFILRSQESKIKSMSITLPTLSVLILLTILSLTISNLFNHLFQEEINLASPYDISIIDEGKNEKKYLDYIEKNYSIAQKHSYDEYEYQTQYIARWLKEEEVGWRGRIDNYILLSDYNKLREMKGLNPIQLEEDEYLIHAQEGTEESLLKHQKKWQTITLNEKTLSLKEIITEDYSGVWNYSGNNIIVVPDSRKESLTPSFHHLNINTKEKTEESLQTDLIKLLIPECVKEPNQQRCSISANITVKQANIMSHKSIITILSFTLFYLAIIFTVVTGTILALQMIRTSTKEKKHYLILQKLGVEKQAIRKTIKKQISVFFLFPSIYPIILLIGILTSLNQMFSSYLGDKYQMLIIFIFGVTLFIAIYILYFIAAYTAFKNNIEES